MFPLLRGVTLPVLGTATSQLEMLPPPARREEKAENKKPFGSGRTLPCSLTKFLNPIFRQFQLPLHD